MQKSEILLIFLSVGVIFYSFFFPKETAEMVSSAARLFAEKVLPSLFAFSVSAKILVKSGVCEKLSRTVFSRLFPLLGVSAGGFSALFIGFLAGFPTGAAVLAELVLRGSMKREEAESLLPFCNNAGASFVIGTAGVFVFGSAKIGMMLFFAQIAASLFAVVLTAGGRRSALGASSLVSAPQMRTASVFTSSVSESAMAMVAVCGYVIFFSVLSGMIFRIFSIFFSASEVFFAGIAGFFEVSSGISRLSEASLPYLGKLFLCGGLLGFGGLSVFLQAADRADAADISLSFYLKGKCLTAFCTACFAPLFCFFSEMRFGFFYIFLIFFVILTIGGLKNKIFFQKSVEKQKGMLYNRNEIHCP